MSYVKAVVLYVYCVANRLIANVFLSLGRRAFLHNKMCSTRLHLQIAHRRGVRAQAHDVVIYSLLGLADVQRLWGATNAEMQLREEAASEAASRFPEEHELRELAARQLVEFHERQCLEMVNSKLRVLSISRAVISLANRTGEDLGMPSGIDEGHQQVLDLVAARVGHRHWLTALVYGSMAQQARQDDRCEYATDLLRNAYQIALEFPESGKAVLRHIRRLQRMDD